MSVRTAPFLAAIALAACSSGTPAGGESTSAGSTGSGERLGPLADPSDTASAAPSATVKPTRVGVEHILVAYKGAENAPKSVTRSKAEAEKRADEALEACKDDKAVFAELVAKYSDDPITKKTGGALGNIEQWVMPESFFDAATSLPVGGLSKVVESPRGFHIIRRTK